MNWSGRNSGAAEIECGTVVAGYVYRAESFCGVQGSNFGGTPCGSRVSRLRDDFGEVQGWPG